MSSGDGERPRYFANVHLSGRFRAVAIIFFTLHTGLVRLPVTLPTGLVRFADICSGRGRFLRILPVPAVPGLVILSAGLVRSPGITIAFTVAAVRLVILSAGLVRSPGIVIAFTVAAVRLAIPVLRLLRVPHLRVIVVDEFFVVVGPVIPAGPLLAGRCGRCGRPAGKRRGIRIAGSQRGLLLVASGIRIAGTQRGLLLVASIVAATAFAVVIPISIFFGLFRFPPAPADQRRDTHADEIQDHERDRHEGLRVGVSGGRDDGGGDENDHQGDAPHPFQHTGVQDPEPGQKRHNRRHLEHDAHDEDHLVHESDVEPDVPLGLDVRDVQLDEEPDHDRDQDIEGEGGADEEKHAAEEDDDGDVLLLLVEQAGRYESPHVVKHVGQREGESQQQRYVHLGREHAGRPDGLDLDLGLEVFLERRGEQEIDDVIGEGEAEDHADQDGEDGFQNGPAKLFEMFQEGHLAAAAFR